MKDGQDLPSVFLQVPPRIILEFDRLSTHPPPFNIVATRSQPIRAFSLQWNGVFYVIFLEIILHGPYRDTEVLHSWVGFIQLSLSKVLYGDSLQVSEPDICVSPLDRV